MVEQSVYEETDNKWTLSVRSDRQVGKGRVMPFEAVSGCKG